MSCLPSGRIGSSERCWCARRLALGLDGNDEIIRNRLVQKMNFLLASRGGCGTHPRMTRYCNHICADNADTFSIPCAGCGQPCLPGAKPQRPRLSIRPRARLTAGEDHRQLGQASLLPI